MELFLGTIFVKNLIKTKHSSVTATKFYRIIFNFALIPSRAKKKLSVSVHELTGNFLEILILPSMATVIHLQGPGHAP